QGRRILAFFTLEKAIYEISYELANRPGWGDIPLKGVLGLLAKMEGAERAARGGGGARVRRRPDPQIAAIVEARHSDPFSFLGMHKTPDGIYVRAMLPGAQDMWVVESASGEVVAKALQIHRDGFFVATIPDRKEAFRYRLRVSSGGAQHEFYDIYSFPPVL